MTDDSSNNGRDERSERITRVIDFRIPLPWLLGVMGVIGWSLVSMYFSVGQLVKIVDDLQGTVRSGNNSVTAVAGEMALLKFRLGNAEAAIKVLVDTPRSCK